MLLDELFLFVYKQNFLGVYCTLYTVYCTVTCNFSNYSHELLPKNIEIIKKGKNATIGNHFRDLQAPTLQVAD